MCSPHHGDGPPQSSSSRAPALAFSTSFSSSSTYSGFGEEVGGAEMERDAALRTSLVALAVLMALVWICTLSLQKIIGTYIFGIFGIAGILLPDWEFFDRDFSQWSRPLRPAPDGDFLSPGYWRFSFYPLRVGIITVIYGLGLYKWWMIVSV